MIRDEVLQVSEQCDASVTPVMRVGDSEYGRAESTHFVLLET